MATAGINFGGIASGLDTNSIIDSLIQIESQTVTRMQKTQGDLITKQGTYAGLRSAISSFSTASNALNFSGAFNPITASSSATDVATVTTTAGAIAGNYNLTVNKLAQAQKIASSPQNDTTTALNLSAGTFVVNGKAIAVDSADSLKSIATKINNTNSGATASLIDGGTGNAYLTLTSSSSGVANKIQLADLSGNVLSSLGILSGGTSVRSAITNGASSTAFTDSTSSFQTVMNTSGITTKNFSINGTALSIDMSTDSLQTTADKINAAGITGVAATVVSSTTNSVTSYNLQITGASTPTFTDTDGFLAGIGIMQQGSGNELVHAQDAAYTLDNVNLTSASNTITSAIPGATLTLLKADLTTPKNTATISMTKDLTGIQSKVQSFIDGFNGLNSYITSNSSLDTTTFKTGPLFSDGLASQVQSSLTSMLFTNVPGLTGKYTNLASLGFSLDQSGNLAMDSTTFQSALTNSPDAVAAVFQATGSTSSSSLSYITSTSDTKTSGSNPYAVNITQIATKGTYTAGTAQTTANPIAEKLTFNGPMFGSTPYKLNLDVGSTASTIVSKINSDSKLKDLVFASLDGSGKLQFVSKRYGANGNFTVVSDHSSASNNSGIGPGGEGVLVNGVDVAGTINGEAATGNGQFLTGNTGNSKTDGLQIQYTGSTLGSVGTVSYSQGIGLESFGAAATFTDATTGALTAADTTIQNQIDQFDKDIATENARIAQKRTDLKLKFANMESAVAAAQQQGQRLTSMFK